MCQFLLNPIDQFLVYGSCSFFTVYGWAVSVLGILCLFLAVLILAQPYGQLDAVTSNLRSVTSGVIAGVQGYSSYLAILFIVILACNMAGLIPFTVTITSFALTTLGLSFVSFIGLNLIALTLQNTKLVDLFLPSGAPMVMSWFLIVLETISYSVRVLSLAIRLFANMLAGHALTKILGSFAWSMFAAGFIGFAPWMILFAISFLELLICALQAYVFVTLVALYINDILHSH